MRAQQARQKLRTWLCVVGVAVYREACRTCNDLQPIKHCCTYMAAAHGLLRGVHDQALCSKRLLQMPRSHCRCWLS